MKKGISLLLFLVVTGLLTVETVQAQGTAFTYQGHLDNRWGGTANGSYDLTFTVYDSRNSGAVVAGPLTCSAVGVTNGLFTVTVDFGDGVFNGDPRWLEIGVRTNGSPAFGSPPFTILSPRQAMLPAPYAIAAGNLVGSGMNNLFTTVTNIARSFGGSATNAIGNNNGLGTNVTIYGILTSTNLDARIQSATNGYPWGSLYDAAGTAQSATNGFVGTASNMIQTATNNVLVVATNVANLIGKLPQYPRVQIATNAPFTNAVLISPDGTNRVWSAATNLFDVTGAAAAATTAATNAVNNLGNTVAVDLTNAVNQFTGAFTGSGSGLTSLIPWSQSAATTISVIFNGSLQETTLTNTAGVVFTNFTGTAGSCAYRIYGNVSVAYPVWLTNWNTLHPTVVTNGGITFTVFGTNSITNDVIGSYYECQ